MGRPATPVIIINPPGGIKPIPEREPIVKNPGDKK
jgi:hypothetical protein